MNWNRFGLSGEVMMLKATIGAAAVLCACNGALAATSVVDNVGHCNVAATIDQCPSSGWISLSGVRNYRFSARGDGYDPFYIGNKQLILQYLRADRTWACLGRTCPTITLQNVPPDAWGNHEHWTAPIPAVDVPSGQRLPMTQLRAVSAGEYGVNVSKVTVQLGY